LFADALAGAISIDGSSVFGMTDVAESDLVLVPDRESYRRMPIYDSKFGNVAVMMCYVMNPNGTPAKGCTRTVLRNELDVLSKMGYDGMNIGFEPEFFILDKDRNPLDNGTYADAEGPEDITASIRREIMFELDRAGIVPLTSHHERAPSACEITYRYDHAMRTCDNLVIGKIITAEVARRNGLYATFEPKPFDGVNGSGLHTNVSLARGGKNAFAGKDGLSDVAKNFLAGVLENAPGLCYLTTGMHAGAYRRFVAGCEAPTNICWGHYNRSAMVRIPRAAGAGSTRIEVRSPDPTMNPYLGVAGILRAGIDGMRRKLTPPPAIDYDAWEDARAAAAKRLPNTIDAAKATFEGSALLGGLLGIGAL